MIFDYVLSIVDYIFTIVAYDIIIVDCDFILWDYTITSVQYSHGAIDQNLVKHLPTARRATSPIADFLAALYFVIGKRLITFCMTTASAR